MAHAHLVADGGEFEVRSPADGRLLATLPLLETSEVSRAVDRARRAQVEWGARPPEARARAMAGLARVMEARADEIAQRIVDETGKPRAEAMASVVVSVDLIGYYRRVAPRHLRPRRVSSGWMFWKRSRVEREPIGVVGVITPWNYPLLLAMDAITTALFAGDSVVVKPSEYAPLTTLMIPSLLDEAGIPEGLVQVVTGDGSTGEALASAPGIDRICFTGSTAVGRKVMEAAAAHLTPVTLELGGKDAAIVLADANLDRAARGIAFGAFFNAGQTCLSIERVFVEREIADDFTDRVVQVTRALRCAMPATNAATGIAAGETTDIGPIITRAQRDKIEAHIRDALDQGATALVGGVPEEGSRLIRPTVLTGVDEGMAVLREETFGPVLPIVPVDDAEEAIERTNASGYGLFASVWTGDHARGVEVGRALRVGGVSVNDSLSHYGVAGLPMGGVGESGFGRRRGVEGLEEMTRTRSILVDRIGLPRDPWWFPYDAFGARLTRAVLVWRARGGIAGFLRAGWNFLRR